MVAVGWSRSLGVGCGTDADHRDLAGRGRSHGLTQDLALTRLSRIFFQKLRSTRESAKFRRKLRSMWCPWAPYPRVPVGFPLGVRAFHLRGFHLRGARLLRSHVSGDSRVKRIRRLTHIGFLLYECMTSVCLVLTRNAHILYVLCSRNAPIRNFRKTFAKFALLLSERKKGKLC